MSLRWFFIFFLFLAVIVGYFAYLNPGEVTIQLPFLEPFTIASGFLMLLAFAVGLVLALVFFTVRDWKFYFLKLRMERRARRIAEAREKQELARTSFELGLTEKAMAFLEEALFKDPDSAETYELKGDFLSDQGNHHGAAASHARALELNEGKDTLRWKLTRDFQRDGNDALAVQTLRDRLEVEEKNPYLLVKTRDLLIEAEDWDEAIKAQQRASKIRDLKNADDHQFIMAGLHYEKGKGLMLQDKPVEAVKALEEAVKYDQGLSGAYMELGDALIAQSKEKAALKTWALGYRRCGDLAILSKLETYYLQHDDPSRIINLYLKHLEDNPDDTGLRFQFASLLFNLEMLEEARTQLEILRSRQERETPEVTLLASRLKMKLEDKEGAMAELSFLVENFFQRRNEYFCLFCQNRQSEPLERCPACGRWGSLRKEF